MSFNLCYRVKLSPTDDAHVEYSSRVKMLTEGEAAIVREMIKEHLGRTVGKVGVDGEQYEIFSSCPNIRDLHKFFGAEVKSKWMSFESYYHAKYSEKATTTAPTTATTTATTRTYQCSPAMATCDGLYDPPL